MKSKNIFKQASSLFRMKKYGDVISLLEPQITLYRNSFNYFYFLGMSCLYSRDWSAAYSYLKKAYSINPENINISTAFGLILVRKGSKQEGLKVILKIVENSELKGKKGYKKAVRVLEMIRKTGNEKDMVEILESNRFKRLFPSTPINYFSFFIPIFILILSISFPLSLYYYNNIYGNDREGIEPIEINENENITDFSELNYKKLLSDSKIKSLFLRAKKELYRYNDNLARREINHILLSNASNSIKQKALALTRVIEQPDFKTLKNSFTFEEVSKDPFLYERCYVRWKGRISNLEILDKNILFDFLVGYEDRKIVEGIVKSTIDFEVLLDENYAYEILAMIHNLKELDSETDSEFVLKIISIRRINF